MSARLLFTSLLIAILSAAPSGAQGLKPPPKPAQVDPAQIRARALDDLLARLREAPDPEAAASIRAIIEKIWAHSTSPTANLLMARAEVLLKADKGPAAEALLDRIVLLYPDWTLAWRRRAQSSLLQGDSEGAMLDLDRALNVDPRNFLVMTDLANLMRAAGHDQPALELLRRARGFDPQNESLRRETDQLQRQVEGQRI
ncbi:hypothetical protein K9U39_14655 [Rhodoblastus acidophilus]|uniref:Tetratricopeptide repeat protein n=1 Tax=Candidatus Rhodoblastus alkanivorans TaxID=2954117 RepID=A0ABS9ZBI6_9HYPH|nr:hypothetical protein [Candidatus Rhodoblastus alkanivorans]MCI4679369.1 hypothetical protein [Candidatus Rhodoblastus alkanivorans]MCI4684845.1 hypothetical protein [Candidatus Rhodoblastus alkanivorans]MDI4642169.1 hypothetical protein [Rhodoblastus acidophilus]